jgi:histone deacetylase complex subunit SAP30
MPPAKRNHEDVQALKEKLQGSNARGRRTQGAGTQPATSSALKEVDNASTNSGHTAADASPSHMKWTSQEPAVLQSYRRAYRLDTPSTFSNPLSHVVLGHGIGRYSPTMARPKAQRRVHKDQLALAVRKNFNALGVSESDVIVDWLYKTKHQDKEFRVRFAPQRK